MSLTDVSLLFLLQMGFGSLVTFAVSDRAALGPRYFKLGGWIVLGFYGLAGSMVWSEALAAEGGSPTATLGLLIAAATATTLLFASVSGWDRPALESVLLWLALLCGGAAMVASSLSVGMESQRVGAEATLAVVAALGSSLVLGFTTWGMILGHWYLVSQGLSVSHLARLVTPLPWIMLGKALISGLALYWMWPTFLGPGNASLGDVLERSPGRVLDVFNVWARIPLGLVIPAVLALMARVTVRMEKTQPATGILYAMCGIVYLGEIIGKMVEGGTGVPY
jgi:hypothetical protein